MTVLLFLAVLVVGALAWHLRRRLHETEREVGELRLLRREIEEVRGLVRHDLGVTRAHLAAVAAGSPPERDAILHGAAHRDIQPAAALALYGGKPDLFVLDVRTPAEWAQGHIPRAHLIPIDELEDRLGELPGKHEPILVHCAAGGRSLSACQTLGEHGFTNLLNLVGGMHSWPGPRDAETAPPPPANVASGTDITFRGGAVSGDQVVAAIRECFDPEIPLNIYDLGLIYGIDIDESAIAVRMTLTSEACPSARTIPEDVKQKIAKLGQPNVTVDVVWDPPWHPSRISADGKQRLGLT